MKKILLSLAFVGTIANAQTLISENFEGPTFPPTGWTRTNTNASRSWDLTNVNFATSPPLEANFLISGTKSACIDWIAGANTANLTTPTFSLVGATNPVLKFNVKVGWSYMINQNAGNFLAQISTNGGSTWTTLWNEDTEPGFTNDGDGDPDTDLYNTVAVQRSLTAYIGLSAVQIRFQYVGNDADAVSIDDVQVLASILSTNEVDSSKSFFSVSPNPTSDFLNIKSKDKIKSVTVYDMSGKKMEVSLNENIVNVRHLQSGTYILNVETAAGKASEKFIKK